MSENMFNELTHEEALVAWMETTWLFGCKEGGGSTSLEGRRGNLTPGHEATDSPPQTRHSIPQALV